MTFTFLAVATEVIFIGNVELDFFLCLKLNVLGGCSGALESSVFFKLISIIYEGLFLCHNAVVDMIVYYIISYLSTVTKLGFAGTVKVLLFVF